MKVVVIGAGYVGLVTGACLAAHGHQVTCVDTDQAKIDSINNGQCPIFEEGLADLIHETTHNGCLKARTDLHGTIEGAEISIIAVGTPYRENGIDLSFVRRATEDLADELRRIDHYHVVTIKSTVIPGTTENIVGEIISIRGKKEIGKNVGLVMSPEFLAEGTAVRDFMLPGRIVIGASDSRAAEVVKSLYASDRVTDVLVTNPATAEMIKYVSNSFLATTISFSNEIANLCTTMDEVDVVEVMKGVQLDSRLSPIRSNVRIRPGLMSFLHPGAGFGGSCFPKDLRSLISFAESVRQSVPLLQSVIDINEKQPDKVLDILCSEFDGLKSKRVAILGVAYKPGTDDVRGSPAIRLVEGLLEKQADVVVHDPAALENFRVEMAGKNIVYSSSLEEATKGIDAVVLITAWPDYQNLDTYIENGQTLVVDARRYLDKNSFQRYRGIGWSSSTP
jgi:UDPglucose 6-dehydrogenase/GDP-mannose 6-dehydrogenase